MEKFHMEEIYQKYSDTVFRTAFACVKHVAEAEDITSEVFIKYFTCGKKFDDENHEKAWLIRVTINRCKDLFKSFSFKNRVSIDEYNNYCETDDESYVLEAVLNLPKKYRVAIHLFYFEGYSTEEIGKITKTNSQTIRTRLSRARKMLEKSLGKEFYL